MSRLPRLHASPDHNRSLSSKLSQNNFNFPSMSRKRSLQEDQEETDQPRKLPAIGAVRPTHGQPLRELRGKSNGIGIGPPPLTKPRATELSKPASRMTRATSAPPKSSRWLLICNTSIARVRTTLLHNATLDGPHLMPRYSIQAPPAPVIHATVSAVACNMCHPKKRIG
jgi:hypothetical protein